MLHAALLPYKDIGGGDVAQADKAFFIKAYFDDLQGRVNFLPELYAMGRRDEALMLTCCYVEALGTRRFRHESKIRNYCRTLGEFGGFEFWRLIHPKQIQALIGARPLFTQELQGLCAEIQSSGTELIEPEDLLARLASQTQEAQRDWLRENMFRASIAAISYERIRSELVHDITGPGTLSFSSSTIKSKPVPDLEFHHFFASLQSIVSMASAESAKSNAWWFEQ